MLPSGFRPTKGEDRQISRSFFGGRLKISSDIAIFCRISREQLQTSTRVHFLIKSCLVFRNAK